MDSISSWIFEVFFCFLCFSSSTKCLFSSLSGFVSVVHIRSFPQMSCSPWLCLLSFKSEALRHIGRPKCIYRMYLLTCEHHWLGDWWRTERRVSLRSISPEREHCSLLKGLPLASDSEHWLGERGWLDRLLPPNFPVFITVLHPYLLLCLASLSPRLSVSLLPASLESGGGEGNHLDEWAGEESKGVNVPYRNFHLIFMFLVVLRPAFQDT